MSVFDYEPDYDEYDWRENTSYYETKKPDPHADHRCSEMLTADLERRRQHGGPPRNFVIKYVDGQWNMHSNDVPGMLVVQCPFCNHRFWAGNQVTIE